MRIRLPLLVLLVAIGACAPGYAAPSDALFDCAGPAGDPAPDTPAWHAREQANDWCGEQRAIDTSTNPAFAPPRARTFFGSAGHKLEDPFRDPAMWSAQGRGRYQEISFTTSSGEQLK